MSSYRELNLHISLFSENNNSILIVETRLLDSKVTVSGTIVHIYVTYVTDKILPN